MPGKTVILGVLIMSLVMLQIHVEARSCCPSTADRESFNRCRALGNTAAVCARATGCQINQNICVPPYVHGIHEKSSDAVSEYCNLGCVSSVCGSLSTFQTSDASEIGNGVVAKCTEACSNICTKSSIAAGERA